MRLNTTTLFQLLIKGLNCQSVYDIGSLDGHDSLRFRQLLPNALIIAFEANPRLFRKMNSDKILEKGRIEIVNKAVSNKNGAVDFYVEQISGGGDWRKGISSLRKRINGSLGLTKVKVPAIRLDRFVEKFDKNASRLALWIDVEGGSYEVLEGIVGIKSRVSVMHSEVEVKEIWQGQKLEKDVEYLMGKMGFIKLAKGFNDPQHDVVFINSLCWEKSPFKIRAIVLLSFILTYLGFLIAVIPKVRPLISKIDVVRRI